jgi:hypothetical protein
MVDNAAVKAFQVGELNQTGTESMLNNLLVNGFSNNNRRMLLSDKSITQFKNDDEAKTGLLNFTANTFTSELMRKTAEIEDLGYKIDFDPNQRQRVREGNNYHPAEAFTITSDDGSTVNKDFRLFIHKLNTLWTLNNSIRSNEEMDKLGAAMVKRVDRDNPEFIKNSATQKIGEMMQLRDKVAKFYERRLSGSFTPSIYSSEEQQATYRQNQMDELATRMRKFDELIGDQRIRLGEIAEGSFSKIQDLPTGLTQRDIDMANATTAVQQGQPLKGNTQEMTMDETGVIKPVPMPDVDESSPKATPMPKTNQVRKITKEELDAFINGMSNRK